MTSISGSECHLLRDLPRRRSKGTISATIRRMVMMEANDEICL